MEADGFDAVDVAPMRELIGDWAGYLAGHEDESLAEALRRHERTGRVLGSEEFVETLEGRPGTPPQTRQTGAEAERGS